LANDSGDAQHASSLPALRVWAVCSAPRRARTSWPTISSARRIGNSVSNVTRLGGLGTSVCAGPIYFENFDSGTEMLVGSGARWSETNRTDHLTLLDRATPSPTLPGLGVDHPLRLSTVFGSRRLQVSPGYEINGQPVSQLLSNNLLVRGIGQAQRQPGPSPLSPCYNLTAHGVVLCVNSGSNRTRTACGVDTRLTGRNWLPVL